MSKSSQKDKNSVGKKGSSTCSTTHSTTPLLKDGNTTCVGTIVGCEAKVVLVVGKHVWTAERDGSIRIRNLDGEVVHFIERRKGTYVWSLIQVGDRVWAGCSDGFIRILNNNTYRMERQFSRHAGGGGGVQALAYHAPSQTVFSGSNDFEILSWHATKYEFQKQLHGHSNAVRVLLADTLVLFSGSDDCSVMVWDVATGQKLQQFTGHTQGIWSLCLVGHCLWSGGEDGMIRIWDASKGDCVGVAEVHSGSVNILQRVGDQIWASAGDTVYIWDPHSIRLINSYVSHDGYISSIDVTAKSTHYTVWTTGTDQMVKVWNTETTMDEKELMQQQMENLHTLEFENHKLTNKVEDMQTENESLNLQIAYLEEELAQSKKVIEEKKQLEERVEADAKTIEGLHANLLVVQGQGAETNSKATELGAELEQAKQNNISLLASMEDTSVELDNANAQIQQLKNEHEDRMNIMNKVVHKTKEEKDEILRQMSDAQSESLQATEELIQAQDRMEYMQSKLNEMDIILKSRLTLISDVFKLFKRVEQTDKKVRHQHHDVQQPQQTTRSVAHPSESSVSEEVSSVLREFRSIIHCHFTDDELAHLGSSKHLFAAPEAMQSSTSSRHRRTPSPNPAGRIVPERKSRLSPNPFGQSTASSIK